MGILDEAIREHLELKRAHGADDSELKQLEDDAFGPPSRPGAEQAAPDPASEAATEFMAQPDLEGESAPVEGDDDGEPAQPAPPPAPRREPIADVQEAPPAELDDEPAEEEQPAGEHEAVPAPEPEESAGEDAPSPGSHSTEERHIIADQPTQMFDVEKEFEASPDAAAPSDEDLAAEEISEPRLVPAEPLEALAPDEPEGEVEVHATADADEDDEDDDDFFDEQRLSDELDQALEGPLEPDSEELPEPDSEELPRPASREPDSEEMEREAKDEPEPEADSEEVERPASRNRDEDVLEETPDFLEEAPEDDQLWFEQKPPKDFDFDD